MLLKQMLSVMRGGEQVKLTVKRLENGTCEAVVTTVFTEPPEDLDDKLVQLRAALCRPIIIRSADDQLDKDLQTALDAHAEARAEAVTLLEAGIADLKAATESAKGASSKGKKKDAPAKPAGKPAAAKKTDTEEAEEENEGGDSTPAAAPPAEASGAVNLFEGA